MSAIYQLTFFLALGLLAIVVTIFVFAISLLGRAMETAARSEKDKVAERKANNVEEMAAIRKEIEEAEASGQIPKGLTRKLGKLEKRDEKFENELSKIRKAPESLTATGGVFPTCAFLIAALLLSGAAWYSSTIENLNWLVAQVFWILSLAAIGYSIYRICKCLNVIQDVAITSEEAWIKKTVEAFKIAGKELEEERKPKLSLVFRKEQPPFNLEVGEQISIPFELMLTQGDIARKPRVYFFAPSGFDFTDMATWVQDEYIAKVSEYITASIEAAECRPGIYITTTVNIKAPTSEGEYVLFYRLTCEGFTTDLIEFNVVVKEKEIPF